MYRGEIPGYYFDRQQKKYFKIVPDHAGGRFSTGTVARIEKENQQSRLQTHQAKARKAQLIQRNPILSAPLAGGGFLRRETSQHNNHAAILEDHIQAYGSGLDQKLEWRFHQQISTFAHDNATGNFLVGTRCASGHSNLLVFDYGKFVWKASSSLTRSCRDAPSRILEAFTAPDISSISIGPTRTVALTGTGGSRALVSFINLVDPASSTGSIDCDLSIQFAFSSEATLWSSAANPFVQDTSMFVIGMSDAAMQFSNADGGWEDVNFESTDSDVMAVEWLTPTVASLGLRNGGIKLWDIRSQGSASRLQHPSRITSLKRVNNHSLVACGLQSSLAMYDLRMPIVGDDEPPDPKRRNKQGASKLFRNTTQPAIRFDHRNESNRPLGFDIDCDNSLVAAGNDRFGIDLFSLFTGERIHGNSYVTKNLQYSRPGTIPVASAHNEFNDNHGHLIHNLQFCSNNEYPSSEPFLAGNSLGTFFTLSWQKHDGS